MERKELESETIGSWDGDIAEYTDFHDYYLKAEADAVLDAYEARIQELEANQPKWVSVKERMPLTIRPVLSSIYGSVMVDSWNGECWESNCHITHWMPLPNPPKETK